MAKPTGDKLDFKLASADVLFPMPLLRFEVANAESLNGSLLKEVAKRQSAEGGISKSNRNGWHSERDLFERKEPAQSSLAMMLLRMMAQATKQYAPDADFSDVELVADGWINVNPRGAYNAPHDHIGSFWSGVYYVRMPNEGEGQGGAIEFLAPHRPLPGNGIIHSALTAQKISIRPDPGTVLIFPSSLLHWVHPNDSNKERVTIAFNGRFRRRASPAIMRK